MYDFGVGCEELPGLAICQMYLSLGGRHLGVNIFAAAVKKHRVSQHRSRSRYLEWAADWVLPRDLDRLSLAQSAGVFRIDGFGPTDDPQQFRVGVNLVTAWSSLSASARQGRKTAPPAEESLPQGVNEGR